MSHYETLGVTDSSSEDEIKKAYKKLAKKHHPDANPNNPSSEDRFKKISAAYSVIGDSQKRAQYDNEQQMRASGFSGFEGFSGGFDPFSAFRGGSPFPWQQSSSLHLQTSIQVSFLDAKQDQVKPVKFNRRSPCSRCKGTGAKEYHASGCLTCKGQGRVTQMLGGLIQATQTCHACRGTGKLIKKKCATCKDGSISQTSEVSVHIPAGILDGQTLRLRGEGHRSAEGKGDLLIQVAITPDKRWERQGAHIITKLKVNYPTLVLGGNIEVETIWGKELVKIPENTKSGSKLALSRKGFPRLGRILESERGSHYLIIELELPKTLPKNTSKKHKTLLQELKKLYDATK